MTISPEPNAEISKFYVGAATVEAFQAAMIAFNVLFVEEGEVRIGKGVEIHGPTHRLLAGAEVDPATGDLIATEVRSETLTWMVSVDGGFVDRLAAGGESLAATPAGLVAHVLEHGSPVSVDGDWARAIGGVWLFQGRPTGAVGG